MSEDFEVLIQIKKDASKRLKEERHLVEERIKKLGKRREYLALRIQLSDMEIGLLESGESEDV
jgi:hypothetical protein